MRLSAIAAALLLIGLAAPADAVTWLSFSSDPQVEDCGEANGSVNQVMELYVLAAIGPEGAAGARFCISEPSDATLVLVGSTPNGAYLTVGGPDTGMSIVFAGCLSNTTTQLLTLRYLAPGPVDLSEIQIVADPAGDTGQPEVADCAFNMVPVPVVNQGFFSTTGAAGGYSPPPRDPVPGNGATGVSVTFDNLGWDIDGPHSPCQLPLGTAEIQELYFGTDPNPPLHSPWWSPLNLQPNTTYYWRLVVNNVGYVVSGPVWSFTTETPNAARTSTWGAVKALYR